ncbi:MAG: winged helix-turn-helix domain-containing protein [Candidatus Bathyarchaeia archaeon]
MSYWAERLRYILSWLIVGTRGGVMRARIIMSLKESPMNANQLASLLGVDYRTIKHHLEILMKNRIIMPVGEKYGVTYFLSPEVMENYIIFEEIWKKFREKQKRKKVKW